MPEVVTIGDKRLRVGDKVRSNDRAPEHGICPENQTFTIKAFSDDGELLVGLFSERRLSGWGDLNGLVPSKQGFWASRDCVLDNFELVTNNHVVSGDEVFKGTSLKGKRCTVLHINKRMGHAFVEFDDNIGAGSADGQGKNGHCLPVPIKSLKKNDNKEGATETWLKGG